MIHTSFLNEERFQFKVQTHKLRLSCHILVSLFKRSNPTDTRIYCLFMTMCREDELLQVYKRSFHGDFYRFWF